VIDQVFTVMALTPRNTYQVLTKARRGCGTTAPAGCEIRARRSISNAGRRKPMSGFPCSCKRRRGSLAGGEHVVSARRFDEARAKGAKLLEQNGAKSIASARRPLQYF